MLYHFVHYTCGASQSMTRGEYFKLCPALVQEQVYTWVIASSFVMLLEAPPPPPPRYGGRSDKNILETGLVHVHVDTND